MAGNEGAERWPTNLPREMTYIRIDRPGGPEVLVPDRMPVPRPGPGEVLIRVAAAGVNRPDVHQRQGNYPPPPGASDVPGLEVAGEVVAVGLRRRALARRRPRDGAGGERRLRRVLHRTRPPGPARPGSLPMVEAGAIPETFFTVWTNVFDRGRLQPGESLLVHGGSSGIGTTAIQLASAFGATVLATAGSPDKCAACERLGAKRAINYREEDFVAAAKEATGGRGVDLILDMVGGEYVEKNLQALAVEGRLVQIAWLKGPKVTANFAQLMLKRLTWTGSTLRPRSVEQKGEIARSLEARVWPLLAGGKVRPLIFRTFPLAEAAGAHALMESSEHIGKIVLTVGG